jgi:hypothetical protein
MKEPSSCRSMRALLRRLGFQSPSIKQSKDVPGMFVVTAYDPIDCYNFCRSYTVEDIRSITHASDIFWRYIK